MKKVLLLLVTLGMLSCTKTGTEFCYYVLNSTQDEITADYTLHTGVHQSAAIPANSVRPLIFPDGFDCAPLHRTYSSFYILNLQGDTIMDAIPENVGDLGNWIVEEDMRQPDCYTKIFIHKYTLVVRLKD